MRRDVVVEHALHVHPRANPITEVAMRRPRHSIANDHVIRVASSCRKLVGIPRHSQGGPKLTTIEMKHPEAPNRPQLVFPDTKLRGEFEHLAPGTTCLRH